VRIDFRALLGQTTLRSNCSHLTCVALRSQLSHTTQVGVELLAVHDIRVGVAHVGVHGVDRTASGGLYTCSRIVRWTDCSGTSTTTTRNPARSLFATPSGRGRGMSRVETLMGRLDSGAIVIIDGGTGTECERRGVPKLSHAWNGGAALSHPDVVRQVHLDYLAAGAGVIIANTFATHRHALEAAGVAEDFEAYNRRGVELAVEARAEAGTDDAVVAAGISNWTWKGDHPSLEVLARNSADQAAALAEGGAELLVLEMMVDISRMRAALDGASSVGLPIWVGLTIGSEEGVPFADDGTVRLRDGELLADAIDALDGSDVGAIAIMHTVVDLIDGCLDVALDQWPGPVAVYAHSGDYVDDDWIYDGVISPTDYQARARTWIDRGIHIVGGCCGTGPEHIMALAELTHGRG
jgi:homocysteine S-methyltransferase